MSLNSNVFYDCLKLEALNEQTRHNIKIWLYVFVVVCSYLTWFTVRFKYNHKQQTLKLRDIIQH